MVRNAHQVQTTWISRVVARSVTREDGAMKILTNVRSPRPVGMVPPARTLTDRTSVFVLEVMRDVIVPSTRMIVLRSLVRTGEPVWMESEITPVYVWMDSRENTARWTLTSVSRCRVRMEQPVRST